MPASQAETAGPAAAVLTGHVDRVQLFGSLLEDVTEVGDLPGPALAGSFHGRGVLVLGTGMGGSATVRATAALIARGCTVLVRAGGAGPVCDGPQPGDLVVATAAVRHEGATASLLPPQRPAVADPSVVEHLQRRAEQSTQRTWVGVVHTKDSFYGEVDPRSSPVASRLDGLWSAWLRLGVLASEMEAAALFAMADHAGIAAGAVLRINDVANRRGDVGKSERELCRVALAGATDAAAGTADG